VKGFRLILRRENFLLEENRLTLHSIQLCMASSKVDVDILIVGAGPVGLFLANECARRQLKYRIVEAKASQSEHSKALAIFPRTMEIFDMAGVVDPFLKEANRVTKVAMITHGHTLAHLHFAPDQSPYPFVSMVPQNVTERLLVEELKRRGGAVEYETALLSASEEGAGVLATVEHLGESRQITASFVVGCDGAHSRVRHILDLPLEGAEYLDLFMLADIETNDALPADELQLCPSELGPVAIFPMSATRRRIVATIDHAEGEAPSLELVRKILAERAPKGLTANALHWGSYFRIHHRHAAKLRVGRMFIAGDAAHIHSPFGGQGMNTGLHDIWNLVWKLDLVIHGRGSDELLESYSAERIPIIKGVIQTTHMLTKVMGTPNRLAQALRNAVIPMVSRLAPFQHAFVQRLSELGIDYEGSPIVEGAGERYFDESLRGGDGILSRFLLLIGSDGEKALRESAMKMGKAYEDLLELRWCEEPGIKLVRPDGYLAFDGPSDGESLNSIRGLLGRQTQQVMHPSRKSA
jgi:2-polyprenyl-6-methoxyphenol hydroxylase-like FAD-dependent oxidoreductase